MAQKPWLTTILTNAETLPSCESVQAAINQIPGYETLCFEAVSESENHYVFRSRYAMLAVTLTDAQADPEQNVVPFSELKASSARAWHWVEAGLAVSKSARQILVAVLPEEGELEPLDIALLLTALTVGVLKNTFANAVYWNSGGMLHEPDAFIERSVGMNRQAIPVELWIEFRLFLNSDLSVSAGSWGLKAFGLSELEVSRSRRDAQWLLRWLFNLAHYMLENGPPDTEMEHTFGRSNQESFTLSYSRSASEMKRDSIDEVLNVQFESAK